MGHLDFRWIAQGTLAGARGPKRHRDLMFLKLKNIRAIIRMEEDTVSGQSLELADLHESVPDVAALRLDQIERMVSFIDRQIEIWDRPVAVTCESGIALTGIVLAAYMVHVGHTVESAFKMVREWRPASIETKDEKEVVYQYASLLKSQVGREVEKTR